MRMRRGMNYKTSTEIIARYMHDEDLCPRCGAKGLEYIEDHDVTASEYHREMSCKSCNEKLNFHGTVEWSQIETEDPDEGELDSQEKRDRRLALNRAEGMRKHMHEIAMELQLYAEAFSDDYTVHSYDPIEGLLDEETFLMAVELWGTLEVSEDRLDNYYYRKGHYAEGGSKERAKSVDHFYELASREFSDMGHNRNRPRGFAWLPDLIQAYLNLAVQLGPAMPTELFVEHIWFYIANEGTLDENWLDDPERVEVLENHVLPLASFILDRDMEWAVNNFYAYPNKTKAERVVEYTKPMTDIIDNIRSELARIPKEESIDG